MTQEIKDILNELQYTANDICYQLWRISDDENLTREERDMIESYAIDADQLAINIKSL